ncbi:hypothetical protein [Erythrobacter sp.]|jgi:predicted ATP-grasp superfamily ATP-dependent carboligase|uniref:hypothetical protein n=1 Tax=Erythrobacter sp. TaxID=1042 RepID=UPI002EB832C6|nr:hypothetical protein [Erythrobacter sp.]
MRLALPSFPKPRGRAKSLGALALLTAGLPWSIALTGFALIAGRKADRASPERAGPRRTVLISGGKMTKALVLARAFRAAGHRVILSESEDYVFVAHRFSSAVDRFEVLPRSDDAAYPAALRALIEREGVDIYLPVTSPAGSLHDSALIPELADICTVLHAGPETIERLDDKAAFAKAARETGLRVPVTQRVISAEDVLDFDFAAYDRPFILKSIAYDPVGRLDMTRLPMADRAAMERHVRALPIRVDNPYVLQEFIVGTEYCTHGFFRDGRLRVHCACRSSAFQVNYAHEDKPAIRRWVETFGEALDFTGQASFDFIEAADDGEVYAIECNPRTHSAITLFAGDPRLAEAYLGEDESAPAIEPEPGAVPTYWTAHEIWQALSAKSPGGVVERLGTVIEGRDAVFDASDPLPFLALHHLHVPALLLRAFAEGHDWHRIDFNIGKLVMAGGD